MDNSDLYDFAFEQNISVDVLCIPKNKSLSAKLNGKYFVALDEKALETTAETRVHLCHEIGHCETDSFYPSNATRDVRATAEGKATRWAVKKLIQKEKLTALLKQGYQNWELAEYFEVTEEFIRTAIYLYFEIGIAV